METRPYSLCKEEDIYYFKEGTNARLYNVLGAHLLTAYDQPGVFFAVWAPNAKEVHVIGDFNSWNPGVNPLFQRWDDSGIWEGFIPHVKKGALYKFLILSKERGKRIDKADPFAFFSETPGATASIVWDLQHTFKCEPLDRGKIDDPISMYELHLGSWKRNPAEGGRWLTYRELAKELPPYLEEMGFTHLELLPVMEHPFGGSWGYQTSGYFAPTSRFGTPQDFMVLVDALHERGISVLLDWVPGHFPKDPHGLSCFDGTYLYEHRDPKEGHHPDWDTSIFNFSRHEVRSFLLSSASFWFEKYRIDGLRVDAVASMLYKDYSRNEGEWIPNCFGGRENLDAIFFLQELNRTIYRDYPHAMMCAEESTAFPKVTTPTDHGGLGFGYKWNMGWMHDTLLYMGKDPIYRKHHHGELLFSLCYAFSENFILPLSHDEVVHGKGSLLAKMPGPDEEKFQSLKLLLGYMFAHPGKKLLFMGSELASFSEWNHDQSLDFHLLEYGRHEGIKRWIQDLNKIYCKEKALHQTDSEPAGFSWIDVHDVENSTISFMRKDRDGLEIVVVVCNFTPIQRDEFYLGVPFSGVYREALNSDSARYDGGNRGNLGSIRALKAPTHGHPYSLKICLPPLSILFFTKKKRMSKV